MVSVHEAFNWMLPGQFEALAHRKAFCELQVRKGIGAGAIQILVLGAGYDTMGGRLAPARPPRSPFCTLLVTKKPSGGFGSWSWPSSVAKPRVIAATAAKSRGFFMVSLLWTWS